MNTREITEAALSAVIAAIFLAFGYQLTFGEYFWYFCASIALSMPKAGSKRIYSYVTVSVISLILCPSYLYLCSFILWLGPYALVHCATAKHHKLPRIMFRFFSFAAGLLIVLWTTPMLFIQLSNVSEQLIIPAVAAAIAVSFPLSLLYSVLFDKASYSVKERIIRFL